MGRDKSSSPFLNLLGVHEETDQIIASTFLDGDADTSVVCMSDQAAAFSSKEINVSREHYNNQELYFPMKEFFP